MTDDATLATIELCLYVALAVAVVLLAIGIIYLKGEDRGRAFGEEFRESLRGQVGDLDDEIDGLKATIERLAAEIEEAREMARKPLTEQQIAACLEAEGAACPRCTEDDDISIAETGVDGAGVTFQDLTCDRCSQEWRVIYKAIKVEPGED